MMFETEFNHLTELIETLPQNVRLHFSEYRGKVTARTLLPWGEHCTECAWPTCYSTCELYSPRIDGACRQFEGGIVRIDNKEGLSPYLMKIRFKKWGKLWTVGNLHLENLSRAKKRELCNMAIGAISRNVPFPRLLKKRVQQKINYFRRISAEKLLWNGETPDSFFLECFNPNARTISLSITIRLREQNGGMPFCDIIDVSPGYARKLIPFSEIARSIDLTQPFEVEIVPNDCDNTVLYFGLMDFVKIARNEPVDQKKEQETRKQFKCIVWDLDNTLWDGTLIEDGPENIRLRQNVIKVIKEMDQRGILNSVASKNNAEDAMEVLRKLSLDEYFLYPQISWEPKSKSIAQIAHCLNIGIDSLAFIDDQIFERQEVTATLPQVTVIDAAELETLLDRPECNVPVTDESKSRRLMYKEQQQRDTVLESYRGDYFGFLKDCHMEVRIYKLGDTNIKRVYELAQRTNQMNFSGNRYAEDELGKIMTTSNLENYVIDCKDRFGHYGIVGFAVVDTSEPRLLDLMFSCRVQSKRVEHGVLSFMLNRFVREHKKDFYANYRQTPKNTPSGKVFNEMGFEAAGENEGVTSLVFRSNQEIPDDQVITIISEFNG